jgi:hypothetical protein
MFKEEYANFLINYGMLQESEMCHYCPLETADSVQAEMYEQVKPLMKKEPVGVYKHGRIAASTLKGGTKKKQGHMNCVVVLVLLGFNSAILLVFVLMQIYK